MHDVRHANQFGIVVYDWSNAKAIWANAHPMSSEVRKRLDSCGRQTQLISAIKNTANCQDRLGTHISLSLKEFVFHTGADHKAGGDGVR
jgi:hypothetical protein